MRYRCRCHRDGCRRRVTLARHPDTYKRQPICPAPGCGGRLIVDQHRQSRKENAAREFCYCGGDGDVKNIALLGGRTGDVAHVRGQTGCIHRADKVIEMSLSGTARSAPLVDDEPPF